MGFHINLYEGTHPEVLHSTKLTWDLKEGGVVNHCPLKRAAI